MSDRIVAVFLLVLALLFGLQAWSYVPIGFTDHLGARIFPLAVALFMIPLTLVLFFGRHMAGVWPSARAWRVVILSMSVLVVYALVIEYVGFITATMGVFIVYGKLYGTRWWKTVVAGIIASLVLYALFVWALDMYLPLGSLFEELF
ncbi:MAG: tripartite tricarboxylate transporter TctB family protein [Pelovirga sp.]